MLRWCGFMAAGLWLAAALGGCTTLRMSDAFGPPGSNRPQEKEVARPKESDSFVQKAIRASGAKPAAAEKPSSVASVREDQHHNSPPEPPAAPVRQAGHATITPGPAVAAESVAVSEPTITPRSKHLRTGLGTVSAWGHATTARRGPVPELNSELTGTDPVEAGASVVGHSRETTASRSVAFGKLENEPPTTPGQTPASRPEATPATGSAITPVGATVAKPPASNPAGKGPPLLNYLLPGRLGAGAGGPGKSGAPTAAGGNPAATVGVAVPRETSPNPAAQASGGSAAGSRASSDVINDLIAATEADLAQMSAGDDDAQKRSYIEKHVYLRMLYLMSGRQERALQAIPGIDPADQEFWQQTFWGLTNYFDATSIPSSAERASQTVSQLTKAVLRLQEKANLDLRNMNFCHKIASFGNYEKYPRDEFSPGQEVLLYAEVANIHSDTTADGKYRTSLKSTLEVYRYGVEGQLVEKIELPETVDLCRAHRRDYFHSYQFTIPPKLTLGPHVLKLTVEDQLSRRSATYSLNFMAK